MIHRVVEEWRRYWALSWWWKGPTLVTLVGVVTLLVTVAALVALGGGDGQPMTVSRQVTAADGDTISLGERVTLHIPPGALEHDTIVTITQATVDHPAPGELKDAYAMGGAFNIDLGGVGLSDPVTLTIAYDPDRLVDDTPHDAVFLAYFDEDREDWLSVHGTVDPDQHAVTVETDHLSWWNPVSWRCPALPPTDRPLTCVRVTKIDDGDTICVEWPGDPPSDPPEPDQRVEPDEEVCATERMTPDLLDWPVRLIGIDTPEADPPECYADEATDKVRRTLEGRTVWVELDPAESLDRIGRILAYVWDGPEMVNEQLVLQGFARERHWFPPELLKREFGQLPTRKYAERLVAAGDEARENLRGVWGQCVEVAYQCHIAFDGWLNWFWDGETCGTTGKSRQMEALRIWLPADSFGIEYRAHVAVEGWQGWVPAEETAGTVDKRRQMEAIQIRLVDAPPNVHVEYRAHVAELGWQEWMRDGATAGTVDEERPMEAIQIRIVKQPSIQPIIIEPPAPPEPPPDEAPQPPPEPPPPPPPPRPCPVDDVSFCDFVYAIDDALASGDVSFIVANTEFGQHSCGEFEPYPRILPDACLGAPADELIDCVSWTYVGAGAHSSCLTKEEYTGNNADRVVGIGFRCSAEGCSGSLALRDPAEPLVDPNLDFWVVLYAIQRDGGWEF